MFSHACRLRRKKDSRSEIFDINEIIHNALGIQYLTDYTYQEQQLIEEVVNRYTYKDQSFESYNNVGINSVKV